MLRYRKTTATARNRRTRKPVKPGPMPDPSVVDARTSVTASIVARGKAAQVEGQVVRM
jgi:hypothetical protein